MSGVMHVLDAGPGLSLQDLGRTGMLAQGVSRGGAADRLAIYEGAALLGQSPSLAALEMAGFGGRFTVSEPTIIALTGAAMAASLDGARLTWNASHRIEPGQELSIGGASAGVYGYLHVAGGFDAPMMLGARSAHLVAGIGQLVQAGDEIPLTPTPLPASGMVLPVDDRFRGGVLRIVPSLQTAHFSDQIDRFEATAFRRDTRGNRMGVRLVSDGEGFSVEGGLNVVSEVIAPGDVQITGDGTPYVLMAECQTTGGYPRMGTVISPDIPRIAQAAPGADIRFAFVTRDAALEALGRERKHLKGLSTAVQPLVRNPADIADLLSYQLISGITAGDPDAERY